MINSSTTPLAPAMLAELEKAVATATASERSAEAMRQASERMDQMRENIRQEHGTLDIGVPSIRELRDE